MHNLLSDSLMIIMCVAGVPMVAIAFTTGCLAVVQAATQIQEQSVAHLVRLVTFIALVVVAGRWAGDEVCALFERNVRAVETIGRRGL